MRLLVGFGMECQPNAAKPGEVFLRIASSSRVAVVPTAVDGIGHAETRFA
jgi:hypothetical protein